MSRVDPKGKQQVEGKDAEIAQLMHQIMELHRQAWQGLNFELSDRVALWSARCGALSNLLTFLAHRTVE